MSNESSATLPSKLCALPDSWMERIFGHMSAYYGALFRERWRDCDLAEVKQVWAKELASFSDNPECFKTALKVLVEGHPFPPTLPEFVAICRRNYKQPKRVAIEHKLAPEELARNKARIREIAEKIAGRHP